MTDKEAAEWRCVAFEIIEAGIKLALKAGAAGEWTLQGGSVFFDERTPDDQ